MRHHARMFLLQYLHYYRSIPQSNDEFTQPNNECDDMAAMVFHIFSVKKEKRIRQQFRETERLVSCYMCMDSNSLVLDKFSVEGKK